MPTDSASPSSAPTRRGRIFAIAGSLLPTPRLAVALLVPMPVLLIGGGSPVALGVALAADVVLLGVALLEGLRLPGPGDLTVRRVPRPVMSLGAETALAVEVALRADAEPRPVSAILRDDLPPSLARVGAPRDSLVPGRSESRSAPNGSLVPGRSESLEAGVLEPGACVPFRTVVEPRERGRVRLGTVHLRMRGPLGLAVRQVSFALPGEVRVLPSLAGVARYRMLALRGRLREAGLRHRRLRGAGTSFESLREHLPGEDTRRVDWKATARRNRLIARNYEVERSRSVMLMVDAGRLMTAEVGGGFARLEHALHAALVLAHVAVIREDRVGALVFADRVQGFTPSDRGRGALERVTTVLADAESRLVEPDVEAAFLLLSSRGRKRSLLVLFTEVVDPEISKAVLAHATRAAGRHVTLVVTQRDAALERLARGDGGIDPYRRAAAEELLHQREQALLTLRRRGVSVLDVPPGALTASLVDRYLDLKAKGLG